MGEGVVTMELGFGTGIYSFSEAALILAHRAPAVRPSTLRRWVSDGLAAPSFDHTERRGSLLSFHELVSVEVVRRLRAEAVSLQRVHGLERALRELHPEVGRPFAYDLFFTDGADIWVCNPVQSGHLIRRKPDGRTDETGRGYGPIRTA